MRSSGSSGGGRSSFLVTLANKHQISRGVSVSMAAVLPDAPTVLTSHLLTVPKRANAKRAFLLPRDV